MKSLHKKSFHKNKSHPVFDAYPEFDEYTETINSLDATTSPRIVILHRTLNPISQSGKHLGIFSGSFNPLTIAHIKLVEEACQQYHLDEILLLLAKSNVDKDVYGLPLAGRMLILKAYAETQPNISIGVSSHGRYIDKVSALKSIYPSQTDFSFIVGYDTLVRIFDPKYYKNLHEELQHLFSQCRFIAANREGADIGAIQQFLSQTSIHAYRQYVDYLLLPDDYAEISSTDVRRRVENGESISHLVPPIVAEFLR